MFLLAGVGQRPHKTPTEKNTIVAAFMLYAFMYNVRTFPVAEFKLY